MVWGEFILEGTAQKSTVIEVDISWAADSRFLAGYHRFGITTFKD